MTHPSDIAGLSERLRKYRINHDLLKPSEVAKNCDEAAAALDSLTARVKELEGELVDAQAALGGTNRDWNKAMARALRAEQQRDEAYERAAKVCDSGAGAWDQLISAQRSTMVHGARRIATAIRRLASGPEGGSVKMERE